uniref:Mesaconyl-CoA C1-C4 CoA transferase n=1 Tax=Candidatus Kentrum sp. TUN TaxID=2126343 RepID=A0A450ZMY9_9GAMM|nr:MAG: mesaconyl-CoA C1-C4 CoA transferase [Candidatus Kentron sp. TUN]VFK53461.1 MAG: mesaconyl-CoA C1-C4 CoA transferase [Candidatus Kentron sp. TUN]VFK55185.1 MAG: mesaconyl-CoA C1-C4 CoA transferase [Candidatus Kentron sp. TUN]
MNKILSGLRVIEGSAFVAAPSGGMTLAQMGADVIRFDPIRGGLDARRWPIDKDGKSLYWVGLNKGKRSLAIDTRKPEGQEIITNLITAPGPGNGIYLTNFPVTGFLSYESLKSKREDLIMVNLLGSSDGTSAVDYTVNCAVGFPFVTGPAHGPAAVNPVNHVFPSWDAICGVNAALAVVAAERHRQLTGQGQFIKMALSDIAFAWVANLGYVAEVQINEEDRRSYGNYLYGAYGSEFETKDGRIIYIVVVTDRMWAELTKATGLSEKFTALESVLELDFRKEGDRFEARDTITALLKPWCFTHTLDEIRDAFAKTGVCWGPYQTFKQMVDEDARCSTQNPLFAEIEQPGIGRYLVPGSPIDFSASPRLEPTRAPTLGEHTDEILTQELGMNDKQIGELRDKGVVAGPIEL